MVAVIVDGRAGARKRRLLSLLSDFKHLLWNLYNKGYIERRSQASKAKDLEDLLGAATRIVIRPHPSGRFREVVSDCDLEAIRQLDLDVLLRFAFGILSGGILDAARFGVWSFHHGDERRYRGRPPGFWEVQESQTTAGSILQRLTERLDGGVVLHRGRFRVTAHSYLRTRDEMLLGSAVWPSVVARQILQGDYASLSGHPSNTDVPVRRNPGNATMLIFALRSVWLFAKNQWTSLVRRPSWTIGVVSGPGESLLSGKARARWISYPRDRSRYLADPFPDPTGGPYLLVEDFDYKENRGIISAVDSRTYEVTPVLDPGVHASYPYLFESDGNMYCTPETHDANEIRLYRALEFPHRWELVSPLLVGRPFLDPTVFRHDDRWWLLCTDDSDGPNTKLLAYHAEQLEGPWLAHSLNPVKTDVCTARPAGIPFVDSAGRLLRPAQNSSATYGESISLMRIDELTPSRFSETQIAHIEPVGNGDFDDGIHTLSTNGAVTLIDGRRDIFIPAAFRREFRARARRLRPRNA